MKFEFELDGIDTENFYGLFQSEQRHLTMRMMDIDAGKFEYVETEDIPAWIRGCITLMKDLDRLAGIISSDRFNFDSTPILEMWISKYGENQYDAEDEYIGHTGDNE